MDACAIDNREKAYRASLAVIIIIAAAYFLTITYTQYASHHTFLADVGVFNALTYGPLYGNWFKTPLAPDVAGNYFGIHVQPYLLLITPFYLLYNNALTLLSAMTLSVVLGALPFALIVRELSGSRMLSLASALFYLLNHFILSIHLANHPESLAIPWILLMFLGGLRGNRPQFFGGLLLALLVKEDLALFLLIWCVGQAIFSGEKRLHLIGGAICIGWGLISLLIMKLNGAAEFQAMGMTPVSRYASMGSNPVSIFLYMLSHPLEMGSRIFRKPLLHLLLSTGLLCLLHPKTAWVGILGAGIFLLTDDTIIGNLEYYYSYGSILFLLMSSALGLGWLMHKIPPTKRRTAAMVGAVYMMIIAGASWYIPTRTDGYRHRPFTITDRHILFQEFIKSIPEDAAVGAQFDLYPLIPHREHIYPFREDFLDRVDVLVLDAKGRAPDLSGAERERVITRINSVEWKLVLDADGFLLFEKQK